MSLEVRRLHLARLRGPDGKFAGPPADELPPGQASDPDAWRTSLQRIRAVPSGRVHFCHHTDVIHT